MEALVKKIDQMQNPTAVGLDTSLEYLPETMRGTVTSLYDAARAIEEFNFRIIDKIYKIVPAVKVQSAYYEMYGSEGVKVFESTLKYAKEKGLITIADAKRNDIGSTAACYSSAFIGKTKIGDKLLPAFDADILTVNPYLGEDGIAPFIKDIKEYGKGIFVLCKTSNPSSGQLQDLTVDGVTIYECMGALINSWGSSTLGASGYSAVGAVVGATYPAQAAVLRKAMPNAVFLVPGYGAQGGTAADIMPCFNGDGRGAVVNNSRGILCAYKSDKYKGLSYYDAALQVSVDMKEDINRAIKNR